MRRNARVWPVLLAFMLVCVAAQAAEFTFTVFGDSQPGPKWEGLDITRQLVLQMIQHNPAVVIGTGDYVDGSGDQTRLRGQYARFFEVLSPLRADGGGFAHPEIPVAFAPGNHDIRSSTRSEAIFKEYFGALYYSFDLNGSHFIILDSEQVGHEGRIESEQWQWLVADLQAAKDSAYIFVALHRPLFPIDGHIGSSMDVNVALRDRLHSLFVTHRVSAVFSGHEHLYNHHRRDEVDYFINGGGGGPLYVSRARGGFHHYVLVTVSEQGYRAEPKALGGG